MSKDRRLAHFWGRRKYLNLKKFMLVKNDVVFGRYRVPPPIAFHRFLGDPPPTPFETTSFMDGPLEKLDIM